MSDLTDQEKAAAAAFGMSEAEYAGWKQPRPDLDALLPDPEKERLKSAVREVMDEREAS